MKNIINRFLSISLIIFIVFSIFYDVSASDSNTSLDIIKKASETKYLENDQGYISKTIVDSNSSTGEVTIELKLSNTKKEISKSNDTEIVLVIDNSGSMDYKTAEGKTRKSILLDSAKKLVNTIFDTSNNVKIGIVKFCGERGIWAPANAASVITKPTSQKEDVIAGLTTIENKSTESGTNIQKGLIKAEELFTENSGNKVIILLTDGCPTEDGKENDVGNNQMVMSNATYNTILSNTKDELININKKGIKLISLMTGVNSNDVDKYGDVITSSEDDLQAIKTIFGTKDNPTAGKFYNAKTTDVSQVIQNDITKDVQDVLKTPLNTIKVTDYFPKDITDNFEFSYVGNPSIGTVSDSINNQTNTIEWNIGTLKGNETAILKYMLKIKDMENKNILNKEIATNEKVVLTYKDVDSKEYTVTLQDSPKIKLVNVEEKEEEKQTNDEETAKGEEQANGEETSKSEAKKENEGKTSKDEGKQDSTAASGSLPHAGAGMMLGISILGLLGLGMCAYLKYNKLKDVK